MTRSPLSVVKVGGSLLDWVELPTRLAEFLESRRLDDPDGRMILVVGGGRAADLVRELDRIHRVGDETAHQLAIRAMDLSAMFLAAILPGSIVVDRLDALPAAWNSDRIPILLAVPILIEIEQPGVVPLPRSWDTTSDSIAARIAVHLNARSLILLKSASLPPGTTREEAARHQWVDPHFPELSGGIAQVAYLNLRVRSSGLVMLPGQRART